MKFRNYFDSEKLSNSLDEAISIGHVTTKTAKIWVRGKYEGAHFILLSESPFDVDDLEVFSISDFDEQRCLKVDLSNDTDRTGVVTFGENGNEPLKEDTRYYVALAIGDNDRARKRWRCGYDIQTSFTTQPSSFNSIVFGFFSCHDPFKDGSGSQRIFAKMQNSLLGMNAQFVIAGGDQVYVDCSSDESNLWDWVTKNKDKLKTFYENNQKNELIEEFTYFYRYIYRKYWQDENFKSLLRALPKYMIWDDHEIMDGWGSYTDDELSDKIDTWHEWENKQFNLFITDAMFQAAKKVYGEYQHPHNPDTLDDVWDYSFDRGDIGFYTLDMRGHHKYKQSGTYNILGKEQYLRFKEWIESAESNSKKALFIVSPVPVIHWSATIVNVADIIPSAMDDLRDEWDHKSNAKERNKILDLVFKISDDNNIPVVFLSGDVHCAASFELKRKGSKGRVFQFTSSAVTRPPAPFVSAAISRESGNLCHEEKGVKTRFRRKAFITKNNYSILSVNIVNDTAEITGQHITWKQKEDEMCIKIVNLS
jgi:alkaline phosphatase D